MTKYKLDRVQWTLILMFIVAVVLFFAFPYKYNSLTETTKYGYNSILHWIILAYLFRLILHAFGFEVYNLNGNIIGVSVIEGINLYLKIFIGKNEFTHIKYMGIIMPIIGMSLVLGAVLLDRFLYSMDREKVK